MSAAGPQSAAMQATQGNRMTQGGNLAFAVTVAVAIMPLLWSGRWALDTGPGVTLAGLGLAYVGCALATPLETQGPRRRWILVGYFTVQTGLLALILGASRMSGMTGLCVLPLVGQAAACLPAMAGGVYIAGLFALILGAMAWANGTAGELAGAGGGFLASFAFVIVFTRVAVREKRTREHAEELAAELAEANGQLREAAARTEELAMAREREVLRFLGQGMSNKEIGQSLAIAEGTVKNHMSQVLGKLGVLDRTQAALRARELGLM